MKKNSNLWSRLMVVLDIQHKKNDEIIWESKNLLNLLHTEGEEFMLSLLFDGDFGIDSPSTSKHVLDGDNKPIRPSNYFIGLDNRSVVSVSDTMEEIATNEPPASNGYLRQDVDSETGFTIEYVSSTGVFRAKTNLIRFDATGSGWGPVRNVFLTNKSDDSGYLVATVPMDGDPRILGNGETLTMRVALALKDCIT